MATHNNLAISVQNVTKSFKLPHEKHNSVKGLFVNALRHQRKFEKQQVLKGLSFDIKRGEFFGIVGRNGSGKSTLLKLLASIYTPDSGLISVNGSLTPFIELGVGFNPELTGRENVFLNGALLGLNRSEMRAMYDEIVAFAELERFMDQKLKNYSSGMEVRLAFSIAVKINSDILLLDEVLAVGDTAFQRKCFDFFRKLKKDKRTVVFISHDLNAIREYCDRALLIEQGEIVLTGTPDKVAQGYAKLFQSSEGDSEANDTSRWGNGKARLIKVRARQEAKEVSITLEGEFLEDMEDPIFGLQITSPIGVKMFESNTKWEKMSIGHVKKGQKVTISWKVANIFTNGTQSITAALSSSDGTDVYDWWEEATTFAVEKDKITSAVTLPETTVTKQ